MTNQLNLAKREIAEMLADADEVADFFCRAAYLKRSIVVIDGDGAISEIDVESMTRWSNSIRKLSRMVEIE